MALGLGTAERVEVPLEVRAGLGVVVPEGEPLGDPEGDAVPEELGDALPEVVPEVDEVRLLEGVPDADADALPEAVAEKEGVPVRVPVGLGAQAPWIARTRMPRTGGLADQDVPPFGLEKIPTAVARPLTEEAEAVLCQFTADTDEMTRAAEAFNTDATFASNTMAGARVSDT